DHLCRFGGDEFAIATIRTREDAKMLSGWLQQKIAAITVDGVEEPVTAAAGIYGGRRTKERENVHYAATLDNLINSASRQATAAKIARPEQDVAETAPEPDAFEIAADEPTPEVLSVRTTHT